MMCRRRRRSEVEESEVEESEVEEELVGGNLANEERGLW